jgi:hypothetical protein
MNRSVRVTVVGTALAVVGGVVAGTPAQAGFAICKVTGTSVSSPRLTEQKYYYRSFDDWDVYLRGSKTVKYYLSCTGRNQRGKRVTFPAYRIREEGASGKDMLANASYEAAYRAAYEDAVDPDDTFYKRYDRIPVTANIKRCVTFVCRVR